MLYQKAQIAFHKLFDRQTASLMEKRLQMISYLEKILLIYKDYPCQDKVAQLEQILLQIKNNSLTWFAQNWFALELKINELEQQIKQCTR